jgi:hypothetical protein
MQSRDFEIGKHSAGHLHCRGDQQITVTDARGNFTHGLDTCPRWETIPISLPGIGSSQQLMGPGLDSPKSKIGPLFGHLGKGMAI